MDSGRDRPLVLVLDNIGTIRWWTARSDVTSWEGLAVEKYFVRKNWDRWNVSQFFGKRKLVNVPSVPGFPPPGFFPGFFRFFLAGAFQFSGDDTDKKIRALSGGEKSRLAIARMLFNPPNFLVLDEPTNHLDLATKEMLVDALKDFEGTMIFVSHDRMFLGGLGSRALELGGESGTDRNPTFAFCFPQYSTEFASFSTASP